MSRCHDRTYRPHNSHCQVRSRRGGLGQLAQHELLPRDPALLRGAPPMSLWCRCLSRRRGDLQRRMLFQEQFERIKAVYPGTSYVCLLDGDSGDMIAQSETTEVNTDEFTRTIINLKDAALQFAATLNQIDPQVVHVKGAQGMFSCYGSAHMILAFYSEMPGVDMELFDCFEADKNIEPITGELHRIVDASLGAKRRFRA